MNIKALLNDDDAVSPVIGVILMVAITVILAAVIASFVLGLGDQNNPAPTVGFDIDYDGSGGGPINVTHTEGEAVTASNVYIRGEELTDTGQWDGAAINGDTDGGEIKAGLSASTVANNDQWTLNVVWEDPDSDQTSTLTKDQGPDA